MLKKMLLWVIVLILVLSGFVIYSLDSIVKTGISHVGSQALGVPVKVERLSISLLSGSGSISGLSIANPKGFSGAEAISLDSLKFSLKPTTLFSNHIVINDILVDGLSINYAIGPAGNNLSKLKSNLDNYTESKSNSGSKDVASGSDSSASKSSAKKSHKSSKAVTLYLFSVKNSTVSGDIGQKSKQMKLPDIELKNLGTDKPLPVPQLVQILFNKLMNTVSQQGIAGFAESLLGNVTGAGGQGGVGQQIGSAVKGLGDKLQGLLN